MADDAVKTQLTTLGSETAPGAMLVPGQAGRLVKVIARGISDHAAANDGGQLIRLEGPGLPEGPEVFAVGASGGAVATGQQHCDISEQIECDIPVTPANEILIFAEETGEDTGALAFGVTLVFETAEIRRA